MLTLKKQRTKMLKDQLSEHLASLMNLRIPVTLLALIATSTSHYVQAESPLDAIQMRNQQWLESCQAECDSNQHNDNLPRDLKLTELRQKELKKEASEAAQEACEREYDRKTAQYYGGNDVAKAQRRVRLKKELIQCIKSNTAGHYDYLLSKTRQDGEDYQYQQVMSCKEECEKSAQQKTSNEQKQFVSRQKASTMRLSASNVETPLAQLLRLSAAIIDRQPALLMFRQEFILDQNDECQFGLNMYKRTDAIQRKWDGSWISNTEIGQQIQVSFRNVKEELTQSSSGDDLFIVAFYDKNSQYGIAIKYSITQRTESSTFDYQLLSTNGENLSLTGLGWFANGANFNLSFSEGDRQKAIRLIKEIFDRCS